MTNCTKCPLFNVLHYEKPWQGFCTVTNRDCTHPGRYHTCKVFKEYCVIPYRYRIERDEELERRTKQLVEQMVRTVNITDKQIQIALIKLDDLRKSILKLKCESDDCLPRDIVDEILFRAIKTVLDELENNDYTTIDKLLALDELYYEYKTYEALSDFVKYIKDMILDGG